MQYSYTRVLVCVVLYVILRRILTLSITLNLYQTCLFLLDFVTWPKVPMNAVWNAQLRTRFVYTCVTWFPTWIGGFLFFGKWNYTHLVMFCSNNYRRVKKG